MPYTYIISVLAFVEPQQLSYAEQMLRMYVYIFNRVRVPVSPPHSVRNSSLSMEFRGHIF